MKKFCMILCLVIIFLLCSCVTQGWKYRYYSKPEYLGKSSVEKIYYHPLFIGRSPIKKRKELYDMLQKKAKTEFGDNVLATNIRYESKWHPASLFFLGSMAGFVERAIATGDVFDPNIQEEVEVKTPAYGIIENETTASIKYETYDILIEALEQQAKIELWTENTLSFAKEMTPKGGRITIYISESTIGMANLDSWLFIVQTEDGTDIIREYGQSDVPNFTTEGTSTTWWNYNIIDLKEPRSDPFKVYVINRITQKRSCVLVYPE